MRQILHNKTPADLLVLYSTRSGWFEINEELWKAVHRYYPDYQPLEDPRIDPCIVETYKESCNATTFGLALFLVPPYYDYEVVQRDDKEEVVLHFPWKAVMKDLIIQCGKDQPVFAHPLTQKLVLGEINIDKL